MMDRQAYVYKFTHLPTMMWYVGSRTAKGCHPNDGYNSSSRFVRSSVVDNPEQWRKEIIQTGTVDEMRALEAEVLNLVDAAHDPRSFNKHNCSEKFRFDKTGVKESDYTRQRKSAAHTGKKRPEHSAALKGRKQDPVRIAQRAEKLKGQKRTPEQRQIMREKAKLAGEKRRGIKRDPAVVAKIKATKALRKLNGAK